MIPAALAGGRADSRIPQEFMGKMAAFDLTPAGRIDNMLKDLEATQRFAMDLRTPMPLTSLVAGHLKHRRQAHHAFNSNRAT